MHTRTGPVLAALGMVLGGCAPALVGPARGPVGSMDSLASSRRAEIQRVSTLYAPDTGMRYSGPLGGRNRSVPLSADIFLADEDRFRLQIKHPFKRSDLFTLILAEGRFLLVDHMKGKAREGETIPVLRGRYPKSSFRERDLSAWQLFFPDLEPREGERVAITPRGRRFILEYWTPEHIPVRRVEIDAHSHVPLREAFYRADGRMVAEITWSRLVHRTDLDLVHACDVVIRLPMVRCRITFALQDPRFNRKISGLAFELQPPPEVESEEMKPEPAKPPEGARDAEGAGK